MKMSKSFVLNKLKFPRNKKKVATIALILTLTIAATLIAALPAVKAQDVRYTPQWIFVGAAPDPVGVGQPIGIVYWTMLMCMPTLDDPTYGAPGGRECWTGITVTITKPDGTKQTLEMSPSDPVGGGYYMYTPDQTGTYSVQAHFPEQYRDYTVRPPWGTGSYDRSPPWGPGEYIFEAADSEVEEFVVQEEPLEAIPGVPLPTSYWTRPIEAYNREWAEIAGAWLNDGRDNPYTTAPETAHIMWTEPYFFGGVTGEPFGHIDVSDGTSYEAKWRGAIIMFGRLYYNVNLASSSSSSYMKAVCRDLRTGELLWERNGTRLSIGTIYEYWSRNQHGTHPYLWTSDNSVLDPFSGTELFRFTNVPSGTSAVGSKGERLIYQWDLDAGWLALWNFSAPLSMTGLRAAEVEAGLRMGTRYDQWRPVGKVHNGTTAYSWNVTLPADLPPRYNRDRIAVIYDADGAPEMLLCTSGALDRWVTSDPFTMYALDLSPGREGQLLWRQDYKLPFANANIDPGYGWGADPENRVFMLSVKQTRQWYGYDLDTGEQLWGPTASHPQFDYYGMRIEVADGKFYSGYYSGVLYAYDTRTGKLLWTAYHDECGLDGPYERWPVSSITAVDGKVYTRSGEHSHTHPLYRTWSMYCFDAETGAPIWNTTGVWNSQNFAEGYMVSLNLMDIQVYCFGKGPSKTTVTAPDMGVPLGSSVVIRGAVTDESAGTKSDALTAGFPNGVPAIADEYMTEWMDHVYKQHAMPTDAKGVQVTLDAIDPNGNFINIGTVTSDMSGMFKKMWEPENEGEYTIIATFEGSKSYWASYAETAIGVDPAPSPAGPIEPEEPTAPLITTEIAILAAVVIAIVIGIASYWALRKRK